MPTFTTVSTNPASPEANFTFVTNLENWPTFTGFGPLPGIRRATANAPLALGTRVRVENTDNSVHQEIVTAFEPGRRYAVRMEVVPPASWLMRHIDEELLLEPVEAGTRVHRRFTTVARSWLTAPVVWFITFFLLKPAVLKHDAVAAQALAGSTTG